MTTTNGCKMIYKNKYNFNRAILNIFKSKHHYYFFFQIVIYYLNICMPINEEVRNLDFIISIICVQRKLHFFVFIK